MRGNVTSVFFSPSGSTAAVAQMMTEVIPAKVSKKDVFTKPLIKDLVFESTDFLLVTVPVFAGRVPAVCLDSLKYLKGNQTPVIATVVYGNRAYDDALLELTDLLTMNGFAVVGSAAMIARHSIFPKVASGRPDTADGEAAQRFVHRCLEMAKESSFGECGVPGNHPYKAGGKLTLYPTGNEKCTVCGKCAAICPVGAIPKDQPRLTDATRCINCTACMAICPEKARGYEMKEYPEMEKKFLANYSRRLEPEFYYSS
ncbi:4Fe-4S binding protein [Vagococcus elongatus]|uniref:4Fe-4S ferredoxin-type domain-containing protein n=1 Tax=Vagococcus elongatus TaxID=180344 RepID=A0A430B4N4_9ENTE|nr:4Fe-4S binding protein [Vagococcus elongatus]RSU15172.1 hypothetical protein CBF29_02225 [Vagococcus elongatus]